LRGKKVTIVGDVAVVNGVGEAVADATVSATWTKPGGSTVIQTATTSFKGVARFSVSDSRGVYTLTVNNISKTGYAFDAANSVLSNSITK